MSEYWARLNPTERRFVVGVGLVFFIVINIFWVWPHFSDWGNLQNRIGRARTKLGMYEKMIQQTPALQKKVAELAKQGYDIPPVDRQTDFVRTFQMQANQSGVQLLGNSRTITTTNDYFIEQTQTIQVRAREQQLVDFLYKLSSGDSLIRVRSLSMRPDASHQELNATITLVASYQKNPKSKPKVASAKARPARPATPKRR